MKQIKNSTQMIEYLQKKLNFTYATCVKLSQEFSIPCNVITRNQQVFFQKNKGESCKKIDLFQWVRRNAYYCPVCETYHHIEHSRYIIYSSTLGKELEFSVCFDCDQNFVLAIDVLTQKVNSLKYNIDYYALKGGIPEKTRRVSVG